MAANLSPYGSLDHDPLTVHAYINQIGMGKVRLEKARLGLSPGSKTKSQLAHHYHVVQLKRVLAARRGESRTCLGDSLLSGESHGVKSVGADTF